MRITAVEVQRRDMPLTKPYTVAYGTKDKASFVTATIITDRGTVGYGSGTPSVAVMGPDIEATVAALGQPLVDSLVGSDPRALGNRLVELRRLLPDHAAARAALDIALHDLLGKVAGVPLVDFFGRHHQRLPTSVTIGIDSVEQTLRQAEEYVADGFHYLKVKIGHDVDVDIERLVRLRQRYADRVVIRVDANQGYTVDDLLRFHDDTADLDLELIEQPFPPEREADLMALPEPLRRSIAADESLHSAEDAWRLSRPEAACGIFNIKLMKAGGIDEGRSIAQVAEQAGIDLMWGCMDESVISIAAALHTAFASPRTRYLDLDGSFDLAEDPARGGFVVEEGQLRLLDRPGLGVEPSDSCGG